MRVSRVIIVLAFVLFAGVMAACGGGSSTVPSASSSPTPVPVSVQSFTTVDSAPMALPAAASPVPLPSVPGVASVGGTITVTAPAGTMAVVSIASTASGTSTLQSFARHTMAIGGVSVTPLYYVGVTNTGNTPQSVNFGSLTLNTGTLPSGSSTGLAHYDPSQPQNGWNQHCASGSGQVTNNGNGTTTYVPGGTGATITIYPGATLWFAPYVYPSNLPAPTPPPAATPMPPTVTPPPSLTGTYVGSAQQTSPSTQPAQYLEVAITQSGTSLTGTVAAIPASAGQGGFFATFTGTVQTNGSFALNATPVSGSGSCPATITGTAAGTSLNGQFQSTSCNGNSGGSGNFYVTLQSANLPSLSGTYSGTINDSTNGAGTISLNLSTPGTVFGGTATVNWPNAPSNGGTSPFVGFDINATTADFAVLQTGSGQSGQGCQPFGTITISGNTLTGSYSGSGNNSNGCNGTGTFTVTH